MSAKIWHCSRLIRSLAAPKILSLGNAQINLALLSTYSIVGCAQDTIARQCSNKFGIALDLFDRWLRPRYSRSAMPK